MIFGWLKTKRKSKEEEEKERREQQEAEAQVAAERAERQRAAVAKVMADLQAARHARKKQDETEADACQTIDLSRASTDTKVRKLKEGSKEITQELDPALIAKIRRRHAEEASASD